MLMVYWVTATLDINDNAVGDVVQMVNYHPGLFTGFKELNGNIAQLQKLLLQQLYQS